MGTRAVVHVDLQPFGIGKDVWVATHWDGYPEGLGVTLKKIIADETKKLPKEDRKKSTFLGSVLQKAVGKATAEHSIDTYVNTGKADFDKEYGDWAEYLYEITPKGELKVKPLSGSWDENKGKSSAKWKILKTFGFAEKSKKRLKEVVD